MNDNSTHSMAHFLKMLGFDVHKISGAELICTCTLCDKPRHLYINPLKRVYDCKSCDEHGTLLGLLHTFVKELAEDTTDDELRPLAKHRGLPLAAFRSFTIGFCNGVYLIPIYGLDGKLFDIRSYRLGKAPRSMPGGSVGLLRGHRLREPSRLSQPIFIAEGEWDTVALNWLLALAREKAIVVGVPGANVFKPEWATAMRGRDVLLAYDNDAAGQKGQQRAISMLTGVARSVKKFQWRPDDKTGKDLRDLILEVWK